MDLIAWLQRERKLDGALLADMGVKATDHPAIGRAVAFPYTRQGETYAAKFRSADKKWASSKGVTRSLYNADALLTDQNLPVVITEGEIDCLTVIQAGWLRAVSLPDGWSEKGNKRDCLIEAEEALRNSPMVIVAGDSDRAGESLPRAVATLLRGHDVRYVEWPEGCKDANDVLMAFGEGEVAACLNSAKRIDPPGGLVTGFSDLPPLSSRRVLRGDDDLIKRHLAFEMGAISVGTGTPGSGKSTFTTWAMDRVTRAEGVRCGMMMFETHPHLTRQHLSLLNIGLAFDQLSAPQAKALTADLDRRFRVVHRTYDGEAGHNLGWLENWVYTLAVRDQCQVIVIDPWNEIEHLPEPGESLTNYINFALKTIREWAETLDVHIIIIAHPKKMMVDNDGKMRAPIGYDVADSAAFANKPSLGFTVHRTVTDTGCPVTQIMTWKVRDTLLYGFDKSKSFAAFDRQTMKYTLWQEEPD